MQLQSPAFKQNEPLPKRYTCDGANVSPPLNWSEAPENTQSFVLFVDDPDAKGQSFIHWVAYNIPAGQDELIEGHAGFNKISFMQGVNSQGEVGFMGACPPEGKEEHRYNFRLYALDTMLNLQPGADKDTVGQAMNGHTLAEARLTARYGRNAYS